MKDRQTSSCLRDPDGEDLEFEEDPLPPQVEKVRTCIAKLSSSCHGEFLSEWSGQRYCPPCRELIRKSGILEGNDDERDGFDPEEWSWVNEVVD